MRVHTEGKLKEAILYEKQSRGRVRCNVCHHHCIIADGKRGICQVRENRGQTLFALVYGRIVAQHVDPVEKKPLFHFYPGSSAYSIGTVGCNFRCRWCQNWEISQIAYGQQLLPGHEITPEQIVAAAIHEHCQSIAYTYTEPTIFLEYAYDTARLAHDVGLANVFVTNGYMTEEMLEAFQPYLDAANVDLKAFSDETYRKLTSARLDPVLDNLKTIKRLGIWLEVTTLVIPGINDDPAELKNAAKFVASELGVDTPWHISRFFPAYKMTDVPSTPMSTLRRAQEIGREAGLRYVYLGNIGEEANTSCHVCGKLLIRRSPYPVVDNHVGPESRVQPAARRWLGWACPRWSAFPERQRHDALHIWPRTFTPSGPIIGGRSRPVQDVQLRLHLLPVGADDLQDDREKGLGASGTGHCRVGEPAVQQTRLHHAQRIRRAHSAFPGRRAHREDQDADRYPGGRAHQRLAVVGKASAPATASRRFGDPLTGRRRRNDVSAS